MQIKTFAFNPFPVNTYLVWDEASYEALLIDPGCYSPQERQELQNFAQEKGLKIKHLLATHLHLDHNFGAAFAARTFSLPLEASSEDAFLGERMQEQAEMFGMPLSEPPAPIGKTILEGDTFTIGKETFTALHIPGHSPGSIVFYNAKAGVAFVGDVIFRDSIGRTDLPGGNHQALLDGIRRKLLSLPDATILYCGHGPQTSVGYERKNNYYLQ